MRLYSEIFKKINVSELFEGARCDFFPFGGGYFQGVKSIGELSEEKILLVFKRADILVTGESLSVEKYFEGDLKISGKIRSVSIVEGSEK